MVTVIWILWVVLMVAGFVFWKSWKFVPNQPPSVGLVTVLGNRTTRVKMSGWRFFFWPFEDFISINISNVYQDLVQTVITPDLIRLVVSVSVTWAPDYSNGANLIKFLNYGGIEDSVKSNLEGVIGRGLREWAMSRRNGPQTFQEALASQDQATSILLETVIGKKLDEREIEEISQNSGNFQFKSLGIVIKRLIITKIELPKDSPIIKAMESQTREILKRKGSIIGVETLLELVKRVRRENPGISVNMAIDSVQAQTGVAEKKVLDFNTSVDVNINLPPELMVLIELITRPR